MLGNPSRSVHVIAGLDPAHGGPTYTVPRLCRALAAAGADAKLYSVAGVHGPNGDDGEQFRWDWTRVPVLRALRRSSDLARALATTALQVDVIHNHGLWLMPNIEAGRTASRSAKPLIVAPRGMLAPAALDFSPIKKRLVWALSQGAVVRRAACIHATSEQEHDEIREFGLKNPVAIIPNGIDLPELSDGDRDRQNTSPVVLALGRVHPKKGLDRLVRAWAAVESQYPDWQLRIVGPDEQGHAAALKALAAKLNLQRLSVEAPLRGEAKLAAYRQADLFVLPTLNENFGITVAEALSAERPVIATKGAPWRGLEREGCGWWIDHGVEPLAQALAQAMALRPDILHHMGAKGRAWMARDFSWDRIARDTLQLYRWLGHGGEPPPTVRFG